MASLRIAVGAQLESSALTVFQPLEKAAQRARSTIEKELGGSARVFAGPYRTSAKQAGDSLLTIGTKAKQSSALAGKSADEVRRKYDQLAKAIASGSAQGADSMRLMAQVAERELRKIETASARAALGLSKTKSLWTRDLIGGEGGAIGIGRRAGIRVNRGAALAFGLAGSAASFATRVGGDILRGAGVETDFSSMVAQGVQQRAVASQIVNSAYIPGAQGAQGQLQDPNAIIQEARQVGVETATDTSDALKALQDFVGQTGDLEQGRALLKDMATLSRATGTSLEDTANAAAQINLALGDTPDKARVTYAVLRQIAGEGKLGAVEMRDLASQMAKVAATASKFEGGAEKNIGILGAIAQEARQRGGAATATQAATSVTAFASGLTKGTTIKNWGKLGINPYTDSSHTELSSPDKLIEAALKASDTGKGADLTKLATLFPSSMAMRAVTGFANIYNQAGGGDQGLAAVREEFERIANAQLNQQEVLRAFDQSMGTTEAKVKVFNNQMQSLAEQVAGAVLPAFFELAPDIVAASKSLADFVEGLTGHGRDKLDHGLKDNEEKTKRDKDLLEKGSHREAYYGPDGELKFRRVYDAEALEAVRADNVKRAALVAQLGATVQEEAPEDPQKVMPRFDGSRPLKQGASSAVNAFMGEGTHAVGLYGLLEYYLRGGKSGTEGRVEQAKQDAQELARITTEQRQAVAISRDIHAAIREQTAVIRNLRPAAPPPGTTPGGTTPAGSTPATFDPEQSTQ